jgi:hypothetical protein
VSRLRRATITCVRGIRSAFSLPLGGESLILRGDNGTGKSSIVQALAWALTGSATGPSSCALPMEFLRHRLSKSDDEARVTIELLPHGRIELTGGRWTADAAGDAYRAACARANPFFRRDDIHGVLKDTPADRFKYLETFLDLGQIEAACKALGARLKIRGDDTKQLRAARDGAVASTTARLPPDRACLKSAQEILDAYAAWARRLGMGDAMSGTWSDVAGSCAQRSGRGRSVELAGRRRRLDAALERAEHLVPPDHPTARLNALRDAERRAQEAPVLPLLEQALHFVRANGHEETCPVCEQPVDRAALAENLRVRVAKLAELGDLERRALTLASAWRDFLDDLDVLEREAVPVETEPTLGATGRALLEELEGTDALSLSVLSRIQELRSNLAREVASIPTDGETAALDALANALAAVAPDLARLGPLEEAVAEAEAADQKLRAVEKAMSAARKDAATKMIRDIGALVDRFYGAIHPPGEPDEVTGPPAIHVQRHAGGTARLRGQFDGQEIEDPQLAYSDGHLDTVGLCIFLALRRARADRDGARDPHLIVFDDVVMSIDMNHAGRVAELLRDEFSDHQILLFSHNELFLRICRGPLSAARRLDINRWTLEDGPRLVGHITKADTLRRAIDETGSAEAVATAMRGVFDDFLYEATLAYRVAIPAGGELTVSDYWGPLKKKLRELAKHHIVPDVEGALARIAEPGFFRNALGAHLNTWALEAGFAQVQCVAEGVLELVAALQCAACGTIPRLKMPRDPAAGVQCACRKGMAPTIAIDRQIPAGSDVEGA